MKKNFRLVTILVTVMVIGVNANAQVTIGVDKAPSKYSLLDLKENAQGTSSKGFHLPRMTEAQRNALIISQTDSTDARGLRIFNLDENCENFWNGKEWISLCQSDSNPEVNIPNAACNKVRVYGQYYKNAPLSNLHYIILPITVTKKGNYTIIANSNNGYYFQTSGMFDQLGTFDLKLDGMGTPAKDGTDKLVVTCNGTVMSAFCNVEVNVKGLTMGYRTDCDSIKVMGSYQTRKFMNVDNYVKVPIDVVVDGKASFRTNLINGIRFVCDQKISSIGPDTLILMGQGSPKQAGIFSYSFTTNGSIKTTCSFDINFFSTLGEFSDPACKCLDIYDENPMASDGEYWLQDCYNNSSQAVKTYCDINNGGWTLVWSYSERTARENYVPLNSMIVNGGGGDGIGHSASMDTPHNRVTAETDVINYFNYRLTRDEWRHFPNSTSRPQLKARITVNPTDMEDEWALNNYVIILPRNTKENPIEWSNTLSNYQLRVPAEGKIFGKYFKVDAAIPSYYGGWDETSGNRCEMVLYSGSSYCTHYNFAHCGSSAQFQVVPNAGNLGGNNNSIAMNQIDNAFGWFAESGQPNHHFGKCLNSIGDYSFSVKQCTGADRIPHSTINGGHGRILQWFVR